MAPELSLEQLREEIDRIDEVIVRLLDSRARCAYAVGRLKHQQSRAIYEPSREAAVIAHVRAVNESLGSLRWKSRRSPVRQTLPLLRLALLDRVWLWVQALGLWIPGNLVQPKLNNT